MSKKTVIVPVILLVILAAALVWAWGASDRAAARHDTLTAQQTRLHQRISDGNAKIAECQQQYQEDQARLAELPGLIEKEQENNAFWKERYDAIKQQSETLQPYLDTLQ